MPSSRILYTFLVATSACATTSTLDTSRDLGPHSRVTLAPLTADETLRVIPHAIQPMLPSADHMARAIAARLGERATVDVTYCVSPQGTVVSAELARSSTFPHFDHAVMKDIVDWRFATQPGPAHLKNCQAATIIYRPRA
jgi:TonB family protein